MTKKQALITWGLLAVQIILVGVIVLRGGHGHDYARVQAIVDKAISANEYSSGLVLKEVRDLSEAVDRMHKLVEQEYRDREPRP